MYGQESSAVYPYRDFILRPIETVSREYEYLRLNVLSRLAKGELKGSICRYQCRYTVYHSKR